MLPQTISNELGLDVQSVNIDTTTGLHIAAPEFRTVGSVHASGEAYVTIKNVYGQVKNSRCFRVDGSIHKSGTEEVVIENESPLELPAAISLPDPKGFTKVMNGDFRKTTDETIHIDTLVLFDEDEPGMIKSLDNAGFDCYDEIDITGNVHGSGTATVVIENVFIFQ